MVPSERTVQPASLPSHFTVERGHDRISMDRYAFNLGSRCDVLVATVKRESPKPRIVHLFRLMNRERTVYPIRGESFPRQRESV